MRFSRPGARGSLLAVHVTEFRSIAASIDWRRRAHAEAARTPDLLFFRPMTLVGSRDSGGFAGARAHARAQVLLSAWPSEKAFAHFLSTGLGARLARAESNGFVLCQVMSTRGSHHGHQPLLGSGTKPGSGPFAALTLGRSRISQFGRFVRHGLRLAPLLSEAEGLIAAISAGAPLTGNCTFSVWESDQDMLRFAYGQANGHRRVAARRPPILAEQLNARLQPIRAAGELSAMLGDSERLLADVGPRPSNS